MSKCFRTVYDRIRKNTCAGNRFEPTYKLKVEEDGVTDLRVIGQVDCYAQIQSHKDSVDLALTLERFAKGDDSGLNKVRGVYGDFTNMPTSFAELSQRVLEAEDLFNNLPLDVRREFNFSAGQFFNSIGSEKFNNAVSKFLQPSDAELNVKVSTPVQEGVDNNEQKPE